MNGDSETQPLMSELLVINQELLRVSVNALLVL